MESIRNLKKSFGSKYIKPIQKGEEKVSSNDGTNENTNGIEKFNETDSNVSIKRKKNNKSFNFKEEKDTHKNGSNKMNDTDNTLSETNKDTNNDENESTKKELIKNDNIKTNNKRGLDNEHKENDDEGKQCHKKQKIKENSDTHKFELDIYNEFNNIILKDNKNNLKLYIKKIRSNFNSYWKECEYQLKMLKTYYIENEKLIKEIVDENNNIITSITNNEDLKIDDKTYETIKIEKKRKILNNIMNIKMAYRFIEMYLFAMRQFCSLLKENNNFISLILDEEGVEKLNYEQIIGNLLNFRAKNYEDIKKFFFKKKLSHINDFIKDPKNKNKTLSKQKISYLYTLKCIEEEISERMNAKEELKSLMTISKEYNNEFNKQNKRKVASSNKLSLFKDDIKCLLDKYNFLDNGGSEYLLTIYSKLINAQNELNANNLSISNNKNTLNFMFDFKESKNYNDIFTYMKYNVVQNLRQMEDDVNENELSKKEFVHMKYITIKFYPKDDFDISILPDASYLKYFNVKIDIFHLYDVDCLVVKIDPIEFIGLINGHKYLSDIYNDHDHFILFSNDINDFHNFKYGFPFFWVNALGERKLHNINTSNEKTKNIEFEKKGESSSSSNKTNSNSEKSKNDKPNKNKLSDIYNWHFDRSLDISVLFSKLFTRILFRTWDMWQLNHYTSQPNTFPTFSVERHLEALKKIQSVSLQQISSFEIITEESYMKYEQENKNMRGKDNIYAYCFIELCDSYTIKSYICVPFNGKEPNFSVFLTKKNNSKRLNKLQDYLNTTVVNKHSKIEDTQRQIIFTLQLAKLREGAHKYHKSFSKNSTSTFDEEVN
ncbi:hypothetical protein YYC_04576 [Plasmodium yoelii 17X]|nr:conserved Plasmodium protein, unknown function [Plasmodium yoelii]ETB57761.1 hypothetical protein YYC_04576 [Plasmodium yoelii 17X]CDU18051.1 conserved Plasmodium protein, unknown function [Plasmodium yoelii]VTZ78468.1 conserved Plasmodium protein, unknown function [Plasmodium yoelii]|eukprot:XP_022812217.1 conserved Plasmodium protein, unknown function [Plasmodium yoelii]